MTDLQSSKALVAQYYKELDSSTGDSINKVIGNFTSDDYLWRGMHPFYEQHSANDVADVFWKPFRESFAPIQRRQDIFMAGNNQIDDGQSQWVCSMGHMMGLFDTAWLGIPPTGKMVFLRYCEFHRVAGGKIQETALFCDIISVMKQAGLQPLPMQTGAELLTPGPRSHNGLMFEEQDPAESAKTLALMNHMTDDLVGSGMHSDPDELSVTWHEDMIWFGPSGIGATYTQERYEKQHQGPFGEHLDEIIFNGHIARFAEGEFGGWFGWANLSMKSTGGFMGLTGSDVRAEMRVVDIYRREDDKLAENWIFIDLLHFLSMQGLDVLGRLKGISRTD